MTVPKVLAATLLAVTAPALAVPMPPRGSTHDSDMGDRLTITVSASGDAKDATTTRLRCHPAGGTHPDPRAACDQLDEQTLTELLAAVMLETDITDRVRELLESAPDEHMVCKVCHRPLACTVTPDGSESWDHFDQDRLVGHKAVPVNAKTGKLIGRCDFCNSDLGTDIWFLPVSDFLAGVNPNNGRMQAYAGDWSACPGCAPLIERNQWNAVARRTQQVWEQRHGIPAPPNLITGWRHLHRMVRRNTQGALYRVE